MGYLLLNDDNRTTIKKKEQKMDQDNSNGRIGNEGEASSVRYVSALLLESEMDGPQ